MGSLSAKLDVACRWWSILSYLFKYLLSRLALGSRLPFHQALICDDKSTFTDGLENPGSFGSDDKITNLLLLLFSHEINEINDKVGVIILHFTPDFDC